MVYGPVLAHDYVSGESYDPLAGNTYPQWPIIDGPYYLLQGASSSAYPGGVRAIVFFNPWGGVQPAQFPDSNTHLNWTKAYPTTEAPIDWTETGGFTCYVQDYPPAEIPSNSIGFDQWMHEGNDVPDSSDGQSRISCGFMTFGIDNYNPHGVWWSPNPDPPAPGIGRDGYYPGSHKMGNGLSGTMPGVYVQNPGDLQVLVLAQLNLLNDGQIQTTQHGGPQDVGWNYHGILRPNEFFNNPTPRQWGVVMSLWSKNYNGFVGYTGDIPWRTSKRDPDYSIQSLIMTFRQKPTGVFGGMF